MKRHLLACLFVVWGIGSAWAHKPSDSYLSLTVHEEHIDGQWDIALRDLDYALALDRDEDGAITWGEVRTRQDDLVAYAFSRLTLSNDTQGCTVRPQDQLIDDHTDGTYAVVRFSAACPSPIRQLTADYRLFFDLDPQHKGLLRLTNGAETTTAVFGAGDSSLHFVLGQSSRWRQMAAYAHEGLWHIWFGYDHVLFLLALLLPSVLRRVEHQWEPAQTFVSVLWEVLAIVTAFTLAHSVTLSLATLGMVTLPSRLVESAIAVSVAAAGLSNLYPGLIGRRWLVAFLFGLIHGFGFATVLADLGLPREALVLSLVSFNIGVELGQLAIVAAFLPLAYFLRHTWTYQRVVVVTGSVMIAGVAMVWLIERAFNLHLWPS